MISNKFHNEVKTKTAVLLRNGGYAMQEKNLEEKIIQGKKNGLPVLLGNYRRRYQRHDTGILEQYLTH